MSAQGLVRYARDQQCVHCEGEWTLETLPHLQTQIQNIPYSAQNINIDGKKIEKLDSAGAWLLIELLKKLKVTEVAGLKKQYLALVEFIEKEAKNIATPPQARQPHFLTRLGMLTVSRIEEVIHYLSFVGGLTYEWLRLVVKPSTWRLNILAAVIYSAGLQALPIIGLLSLLIGIVLTFQMGLQLQNYGANIFIVDLVGLSILREFGPLITAIMVAGRTGSAFTATIGMMKLNEEIDALKTLGVTPAEILLLPRIIGLFIVLPLLTMWADIFGVVGGMIMSNNMLDIPWKDFIDRFKEVIPLKTFLIGIGKTPVFALLIASIGCYEGMKVKNSADSVGSNTTKSVVLAIFFIIVADAAFSIIFSKLKL